LSEGGELSGVLCAYNDVVDGNVDELDEESDESHDAEPDGGGDSNLLKLLPVRFSTSLH